MGASNRDILEIIFVFTNICYAIIELIILHDSTSAEHECGPDIFYCLITCCVSHYLVLITYLYCAPPYCFYTLQHHKYKIMVGMLLPGFIWSVVCGTATDDDCKTFFKDNYLHLWNMVIAEYFTGMILMVIYGIVLIYQKYIDRSTNVELAVPIVSSSQVNYVTV